MRRRIVPIDATAEHGDGVSARFKCAAVRLAVHAARQPADDHDSSCGKIATENARDLRTVGRARPRADDGDGGTRKQPGVARTAQVQVPRRIVDRPEKRRQLVSAKERHTPSSGGAR